MVLRTEKLRSSKEYFQFRGLDIKGIGGENSAIFLPPKMEIAQVVLDDGFENQTELLILSTFAVTVLVSKI